MMPALVGRTKAAQCFSARLLKQHLRSSIQILVTHAITVFLLLAAASPSLNANDLVRFAGPQTLGFADLVALASADPAPPDVEARLDTLLSQPFVSNEAAFAGADPLTPNVPGAGRVLRIAEWNINREDSPAIRLALSDLSGYEALVRRNPRIAPNALREAVEQARHLEQADVIVLNEVDDGVGRTGYHNVTRDIAMRLHMNYVFATEFIELTPLYLGVNRMDTVDLERQRRTSEKFGVDPNRYLGLEGSALLSRFPIRSARIVHLPEAYDWYHKEIGAISDVEKAQNWSTERIFGEQLKRQVRRGGRIMIVADLEIPGPGGGVLTMVCPHLEDYSNAKGRHKQMKFVLSQIGNISNPVVMAGDLNTMGHNAAPITARREIRKYILNYRFWVREAMYVFAPVPGLNYAVGALNYLRTFHDPTAVSIPVLASNHERALFDSIRAFRFDDGGTFDWAGNKRYSTGHKGRSLSVTNERGWKGFEPTFGFVKTYHGLVGEYKLDWIFVKQPARFTPLAGETLWQLNVAPAERISDHSPTTIDLVLPRLRKNAD